MAFTGLKIQSRKTARKQAAAVQPARVESLRQGSGNLCITGSRQASRFPDLLTHQQALSACLMARFTATANRLRSVPPSCHAFSADKKRRVTTPQRLLTFPTKYCIKIQYRVHAIRPTASHLRRLAAGGRVAYRRVPSGAVGMDMCRRLPSARQTQGIRSHLTG